MNSLLISEDDLNEYLPGCKDGESGEFTVKGKLHIMDGMGVVMFDSISKKGYKKDKHEDDEDDDYDEDEDDKPMKKKMSAGAAAVIGKKEKY